VHVAWWLLPPEAAEPYAMILGSGLHPLQWLTHNFLHADIIHLTFNMFFLWMYGIIVEGKIGWFPFLLSYLSIGTVHGAVIQTAYLHAATQSHVLGASGIIFGLMAIAMIWAPANELSCFYFFFFGLRIFTNTFEVPIYVFALVQFALEGLSVALQFMIHGDPMSSGLLHISGAFWGLLVGILLLKAHWVDCEGWDVFSLIQKRRALRKAWKAREARLDGSKENERLPRSMRAEEDRASVPPEVRAAKLLTKVHQSIEMGDMTAAEAAYGKWMSATGNKPPREALLGIIKAMHQRDEWAAAVPPMRAFCRLYPARSDKLRLKLASVLIRKLDRPTEAHRHLQQISGENLDANLQGLLQKLRNEAEQMIEDGVMEVEEDV
jgi:membrane associated rhomboid family serine protease